MDQQLHFTTPTNVVMGFYKFVDNKQFPEAFGCLTESFQDRIWQNDIERFELGYASLVSLKNMVLEEKSVIVEGYEVYPVSYDMTVQPLRHHLIDGLVGMKGSAQKNKEVQQQIAEFKQFMVSELGADEKKTAEIPEARFFEPNNVEVCLWMGRARRSFDSQGQITRAKEPETFKERRGPVFEMTQEGWRIDGLKRLEPLA